MLDPNFFMQHIFGTAKTILGNNQASLGMQFCQEFMHEHDLSGHSVNAVKNATTLYEFVIANCQNPNGGPIQIQPQQLFNVVTHYIGQMHQRWLQANQQNQMMRPQVMGMSPQGFTSPMGGMQPQGMGAAVQGMGDVITPMNQQRPAAMMNTIPVAPVQQPTQQQPVTPVPMAENPLDALGNIEVDLIPSDEAPNWGVQVDEDRSIIVLNRQSIKSRDEKVFIRKVDGFLRTYYDTPLSVAQHFFRVVPDQFLAESFIFRLYYNNIEIVPVSTEIFKGVRDAFIEALAKDRKASVYTTIIKILDDLTHGARCAMAKYLLKHINRAMHLSGGMVEHPEIRIRFGEIEDLKELLGTGFNTKLFEVPRSKEYIQEIISTALTNALIGYSDVLFSSLTDCDPSIIKTSPVFPFNLHNVYPNKVLIPNKDDDENFREFYTAMGMKQLTHKTFVRSIRSVIVTNILGGKALNTPKTIPTNVPGDIASILGTYAIDHLHQSMVTGEECKKYNQFTAPDGNADDDLKSYLENPEKYERAEYEVAAGTVLPVVPVDQVLFAVQFKKNPNTYIEAFDIFTAMDYNAAKHPLVMARTPGVLDRF